MIPPPKLTDLPLWQNFAARAVRVLREALARLPELPTDTDEFEMNRQFYASIAEANRSISLDDPGAAFDYMPSYDGHQAPANIGQAPDEFEAKRPDFCWSLQDHNAESGLDGCREFVVECKRLGNDVGGTNFNQEYVDNGIVRFAAASHMYGLRGAEGAMVGYVQRSEPEHILGEIVARILHHGLDAISVASDLQAHVCELTQSVQRAFGESPFALTHLWVDMRPASA